MKKLLLVIFVITFSIANSIEKKTVIVGVYPFSPYVNYDPPMTGITIDFIKLLNETQDEFLFVAKDISPRRRYEMMKNKNIDIMIFEDTMWEWSGKNVGFSNQFVINGIPFHDGELYVALKEKTQNQSYFNNLKDKKLLITHGYHYSFANFNSDEAFLKSNFNVDICLDPEGVIKKLLKYRGDIGLIDKALLNRYIKNNPQDKDKFFVSKKLDAEYHFVFIVGNHSPITKKQINMLISKLEKNGKLDAFFKKNYLIE